MLVCNQGDAQRAHGAIVSAHRAIRNANDNGCNAGDDAVYLIIGKRIGFGYIAYLKCSNAEIRQNHKKVRNDERH